MRDARASYRLRSFAISAIAAPMPRFSGSAGARRHACALRSALFLAGLAAAISAPVASAQAAPGDECAGLASAADEIACLRRALSASNAERERLRGTDTSSRQATRTPAAPVVAIVPPAAAPSPSPVASQAAQPAPSQTDRTAGRAETPGPAAPPASRPTAATQGTAATMGAEQLSRARDASEREERPVLQATIVSNVVDREGLLNLVLDNGQRWKQVERPSIQIQLRSKANYTCEITPSGFGGYRMFIPEIKRTIVVRRVN